MKNLKVVSNIGKNRLYFTISGKVTKKEVDSFYTEVRFCVADLEPSFDVISDFSECKLAHLGVIPTFRKIMGYLITSGVGEVVRVMPDKCIFCNQIMQLAARSQGYSPICVFTLEEAEDILENSVKRNGLRFHLHPLPVEYVIDDTKGEGHILNISTSGFAAVALTTLHLSVDMEMKIQFAFVQQENSPNIFKVKARVVRVEDDAFAAEFKDLEDEQKEQLWKCLVYESEREIIS